MKKGQVERKSSPSLPNQKISNNAQEKEERRVRDRTSNRDNNDVTESLANLSLDRGNDGSNSDDWQSDQQSTDKLNKLKLKKKSVEQVRTDSVRVPSASGEWESVSRQVPTLDTDNSKYRDLSNTSSSSSGSEAHISDSNSPSPSHKYAGVSNIRIKKKTPQKEKPEEINCDIPLAERIRLKSGDSNRSESIGSAVSRGSSPPAPRNNEDIIDLTSDDDNDDPLPQMSRPKSPEDTTKRYVPPAHAVPSSTSLKSASQAGSASAMPSGGSMEKVGLTPAEKWQLEQDIATRNNLLNQLRKQKVHVVLINLLI